MWIPVIDGALELQCAIGRIYPLSVAMAWESSVRRQEETPVGINRTVDALLLALKRNP